MRQKKGTFLRCILLAACICILTLAFTGCREAGNNNGGDTKPHTHDIVKHEGEAPTCTEEGYSHYETCSGCEEYTTYKAIPATGHSFNGYAVPISGTEMHSVPCTNAGCTESTALPHEWHDDAVVTEASCEGEGTLNTKCECGAWKHVPIAPLGHSYTESFEPNGDVHSKFCTKCTSHIDMPHEWQEANVITEATCKEAGSRRMICDCGGEMTDTIPATGLHTEGEWITVTEAGAVTAGCEIVSCTVCGDKLDEREIPPDVSFMPILYMVGDYTSATNAKNEVEMTVEYKHPAGNDFSGYALIKVQGATSTRFTKKNYTIKFYKDEECESKLKVDLGWGKESKYCMKANWVDSTQARNVVSAKIWKDIAELRPASEVRDRLLSLATNAGAIDGFPIAVYMNGEFYGLYTMNVPKDEWMFGMDDVETEALLAADDWVNTDFSTLLTEFTVNSSGDYVANNGGWELKYFGTEKTTGSTAWVTESFNKLISFCQNNTGEDFKNGISEYLDVDAAIDYLIYMYAIYMRDNSSKNMLWATYDGKVWFPTVYDQDGTFGMAWDGYRIASAKEMLPAIKDGKIDAGITLGSGNFILWNNLWESFTEEILLRYQELRASVLNTEYMKSVFEEFRAEIPESVYAEDRKVWESERESWWASNSSATSKQEWYEAFNYEYIYGWLDERFGYFDAAMAKIGEHSSQNN